MWQFGTWEYKSVGEYLTEVTTKIVTMATIVYNKDNSELSTSTDSFTFELSDRDANYLFTFENGLDSEVTITTYGTHRDDLVGDDIVQVAETTVAASSDDYETLLSDPWERVYIEVTPTTDPSSGSIVSRRMSNR